MLSRDHLIQSHPTLQSESTHLSVFSCQPFGAHERWMSWKDGCADRTVRSPLIGSLKNFTYLYFLLDSSKQFTLSKLRKGRHIFCCFPSCRDCVPSCVACSGITDIGDELFHRRCTKEKKINELEKKMF